MFYSATSGFYCRELHGDNIPDDAVEITDEHYAYLIAGHSEGKRITVDGKGMPELTDAAPASAETLARNERAWRDAGLAETDGMVSRHRDETEAGGSTTLTDKQYTALQAYRQALRGWPDAKDFPEEASRPTAPGWLNNSPD